MISAWRGRAESLEGVDEPAEVCARAARTADARARVRRGLARVAEHDVRAAPPQKLQQPWPAARSETRHRVGGF